jgi:hypothetical protein
MIKRSERCDLVQQSHHVNQGNVVESEWQKPSAVM